MLHLGPLDPLKLLLPINYYFLIYLFPMTTRLLPFTPVQPNPPLTVTYVDNYRCFANHY